MNGHLDIAIDAYRVGDQCGALDLLLPLARDGDALAQRYAGLTYLDDIHDNPCRSVSEAVYWLQTAADRNDARAAYELGRVFKHGEDGLRVDRSRAKILFRKAQALSEPAAEAGSAEHQFVLGAMRWQGDGVRKNAERGLRWLRLAAEQGDVDHQSLLSIVLWWAPESVGNMDEAVYWTTNVAEQGHVGAQYHLAANYAVGEMIARDSRKAAKWYRRAAKQGHPEATYNLGIMYLEGEGMPSDPRKGMELLAQAADLGFTDAMGLLSAIHAHGLHGQPRDSLLAAQFRLREFEAGNTLAAPDLARDITNGRISIDALCAALEHWPATPDQETNG